MRAVDVRGLCPDLRRWAWTPELYDETQAELAVALLAASPRVGRAGLGTFWLDAAGWDRLGGEDAFVEAARSSALAAGYPEARIGIADTAVAARAATLFPERVVCRVPPGADAAFLAPLPLGTLALSDELEELLAALGLGTVGELAALEPAEVEGRLGIEGLTAHRRARGLEDGRDRPGPGPSTDRRTVEVELPGPTERAEPLLFLLKSCLDRLSEALAREGRCVKVLRCVILTEDGVLEYTVRPARPTRRVSVLLALAGASLTDRRLPGRAVGVRVEVDEVAPAAAEQTDLFEAAHADPEGLMTALSRLQARWGREAVVRPLAMDSHRPEKTGRWEPVDLLSSPGSSRPATPASSDGRPPDIDRPALLLRLWPEPRPVDVRIEDGRPGALAVGGAWRSLVSLEGPERLSGEWWDDPYRREYFRVGTEAGELLWVFYDPRRQRWYWHGWWD